MLGGFEDWRVVLVADVVVGGVEYRREGWGVEGNGRRGRRDRFIPSPVTRCRGGKTPARIRTGTGIGAEHVEVASKRGSMLADLLCGPQNSKIPPKLSGAIYSQVPS